MGSGIGEGEDEAAALYVVWVQRSALSEAVAAHVGHDADKAFGEAVAWSNQGHHRVWIERAANPTATDVAGGGLYRHGKRVGP